MTGTPGGKLYLCTDRNPEDVVSNTVPRRWCGLFAAEVAGTRVEDGGLHLSNRDVAERGGFCVDSYSDRLQYDPSMVFSLFQDTATTNLESSVIHQCLLILPSKAIEAQSFQHRFVVEAEEVHRFT